MVHLTSPELEQNEQGILAPRQKQRLRRQRLVWVGGTVAFAVLALLIVAAVVWKAVEPAFAGRGQFYLALPLGLFWLWLLRPALGRWRRTNEDLGGGEVAWVEGMLRQGMSLTPGLWQRVRYEVEVDGRLFRVDEVTYRQLQEGRMYRVYYAPHSGLFLGARPLAEGQVTATEAAPSIVPLAEPLRPQELEILRLIAAGYANKEIARELHLSVNTVKMYASQLYRKLEVERRTEAVARGRALGLLE